MVRGGYGSGSGVPLGERLRAVDEGRAPVPAGPVAGPVAAPTGGPTPPEPTPTCPARHCWVTVPVDGARPRAGLLLEWRKVERGRWEGRVVYAAELRPGRWASVEEWVPAELLSTD